MALEVHALFPGDAAPQDAPPKPTRRPFGDHVRFGLLLALTANSCLWLGLYLWTLSQNQLFGPAESAAGLWLGAILSVCSAPAGLVSHAACAGASKPLSLARGALLALICVITGLLIFALLCLVWTQTPFELRPNFAYPGYLALSYPFWLQLSALAGALLLISILNVALIAPIGGWFLKSPSILAILVGLLLIQPALSLGGPAQLAALRQKNFPASNTVIARDEDIDLLIRQKGLSHVADLSTLVHYPYRRAPLFAPEKIARVQASLNLPATGLRDEALLRALSALPDKTDWVLDFSGGGDATTMAEILAISWGPIRINIRPGVYSPEAGIASAASPFDTQNLPDLAGGPLNSSPKGPLARALWEQAHMRRNARAHAPTPGPFTYRTIALKPDADGGILFLEVQPIEAPSDFRLEHATIQFELARSIGNDIAGAAKAALTIAPGAHLKDVRILAPGPQDPLYVSSQIPFPAGAGSNISGPDVPDSGSSPELPPRPPLFAAVRIISAQTTPAPAIFSPANKGDGSAARAQAASGAIAVLDQVEILKDGGDVRFGLHIEGPTRLIDSRIGAMREGCIKIDGDPRVELSGNDFKDCAAAGKAPVQSVPAVGADAPATTADVAALFPDLPPRASSANY